MKHVLAFLGMVLALVSFAGGASPDVTSLSINSCGKKLMGNVVLTIKVLPTSPYDQPSNSCEVEGENVKLTFWVPVYLPPHPGS